MGTAFAEAAPPKAMPKGMTNAASGAISTAPRQTPRAVKRGCLAGSAGSLPLSVGLPAIVSWQPEDAGLSTSARRRRGNYFSIGIQISTPPVPLWGSKDSP